MSAMEKIGGASRQGTAGQEETPTTITSWNDPSLPGRDEGKFVGKITTGLSGAYIGSEWAGGGVITTEELGYEFGKTADSNWTHSVGLDSAFVLDRLYGNYSQAYGEVISAAPLTEKDSSFFLYAAPSLYWKGAYGSGKLGKEGHLKVGGGFICQSDDVGALKFGDKKYAKPYHIDANDDALGGYLEWKNEFNDFYTMKARVSLGSPSVLFYTFGGDGPNSDPFFHSPQGLILSVGLQNTFMPLFGGDDNENDKDLKVGLNFGGQQSLVGEAGSSLVGILNADWTVYKGEFGKEEKKPWDVHLRPGVMVGGVCKEGDWKTTFLAGLEVGFGLHLGKKIEGKNNPFKGNYINDLSIGLYGAYVQSEGDCFSDQHGASMCSDGSYGYNGLAQYYGSGTGMKDAGYDATTHGFEYGVKVGLNHAFDVQGLSLSALVGAGSQAKLANGEGGWTTKPMFKLGIGYTIAIG